MSEAQTPFIAPRVVAGLVIVSALSLLAFLVLNAFAPDLRNEKTGGGNALSKSAIGYAGLRFLVEHTDTSVTVRRDPAPCDRCSLEILAPEAFSSPEEIEKLLHPGPRLVVLPKWTTMPVPLHAGWVMKTGSFEANEVAHLLTKIDKSAKIVQAKNVSRETMNGSDPRFADVVEGLDVPIETLQTISGKLFEPVIVDRSGRAILVQVKGSQTYILSDPDFVNNRGVHNKAVAGFAFGLIDVLRVGDAPVAFDVTLNGFRRSPDLLRAVFSPPFLGATLCAILAAAFIAFHALSRFGSPVAPDRIYAFGKRALADNTAAVIRLMRREPRMARRYAQAMLHQVAAHTGLPRERVAEPGWTATLEKRTNAPHSFAELDAQAARVVDTYGLLKVAERLYRWRRGILNERN